MKDKVHICGTWYILFRSPREFRLIDIHQWENLHKLRQPKTTRGEGALQLKGWKPYISPFLLMQTAIAFCSVQVIIVRILIRRDL